MIFLASFASQATLFEYHGRGVTASSIRTIKKEKMLQMLRKKNKLSNSLVAYLLSSVKRYRDHVAHLLTSSAEKRLASVLLRLAHMNKKGLAVVEIPPLKSPSFGGNGWYHATARECVHESVREAGIHKLRWGVRSAQIAAESSVEPLGVTCNIFHPQHSSKFSLKL